jgi:murein DD-endopeptidase MepM/ murein hydrolase activator NlpD
VIGLLGNTGNTDSPHLHFQIMDSPDPLASNGLPFVFDRFGYQGKVVSDANLNDAAANGVPIQVNSRGAGTLTKVSPLVLDIMTYKP